MPGPSPKFFRLELASTASADFMSVQEDGQGDGVKYVTKLPPGTGVCKFENGRKWSNVVRNNYAVFIAKQSFSNELVNCGCSGLDERYPVIVDGSASSWFKKNAAAGPSYTWIRIKRDLMLDPASLEWPKDAADKLKLNYKYSRFVPIQKSHGGLDVFGANLTSHLFCTRKFVEKCRENRWNDFYFLPMDLPRTFLNFPYPYIDHLGKTWPPERWYPEGVEPHPANIDAP